MSVEEVLAGGEGGFGGEQGVIADRAEVLRELQITVRALKGRTALTRCPGALVGSNLCHCNSPRERAGASNGNASSETTRRSIPRNSSNRAPGNSGNCSTPGSYSSSIPGENCSNCILGNSSSSGTDSSSTTTGPLYAGGNCSYIGPSSPSGRHSPETAAGSGRAHSGVSSTTDMGGLPDCISTEAAGNEAVGHSPQSPLQGPSIASLGSLFNGRHVDPSAPRRIRMGIQSSG